MTSRQTILAAHAGVLAQDPERALKLADVNYLAVALKAPLPLGLQAGTIRLDQDRMLEPTQAVLEIKVVPDGEVWRSEKFPIGPAATEGMGWVGTVPLEPRWKSSPHRVWRSRSFPKRGMKILLMVTCPPLVEGVGPAGHGPTQVRRTRFGESENRPGLLEVAAGSGSGDDFLIPG